MQNTTLIIIFKILQEIIHLYIYYIYAINKSFHQYAIREKNFSCAWKCVANKKKVEHKDNFIFNAKSFPVFNYPRNRFVQIKTKSCNNVSTTMHSA